MISTRDKPNGVIEVYPKFIIKKSSDLMIRGGDFYAIWVEERGLWSTDEHCALQMIDRELDIYVRENRQRLETRGRVRTLHMWDAGSGMIDRWHKYCQKQMRDNFITLDEKLIFSNHKTTKKDYASKILPYPLAKGDIVAYDKLMSTLYSKEERHKIEWAIGSIVSGDSVKIQKFLVLYGAAGTGKSTVLNIIQQLFEGYYSVFDARALGSSNNSFALEAFKSNPLVAIQHDGDLSRIEDNTRLNSLVAHEIMTVNEKFKSTYANQFKSFLFMGTNKPVKITDARSGLLRRLIDVSPTGETLKIKEYKQIVKQIGFELGAIAYYCKEVYLKDPGKYDDYIPTAMMGASNDFYNFMLDSYHIFKQDNGITMKAAWEMYKTYCDEAKVTYPFSQRVFKEELRSYFKDFHERFNLEDGTRVRSYYFDFKTDKFKDISTKEKEPKDDHLIKFKKQKSIFDRVCEDCYAQYATPKDTPFKKWEDVDSKLYDLDTSRVHFVRVPENHIVIDFDIPDEDGNKSYERNLAEASKWPPTYSELSKSGAGIHLHYIYIGDVSKLNRVYGDHIEVKVFTGKSSLRRKLTECNNLPISTISSGLPLKGEKQMVNFDAVKSEKGLRTLVKRNLNKEIHNATKPSIDFIYKILEDAHNSDLKYDITDMRNAVLAFAANSTNQSDYCIKLVNKMQFKSEEPSSVISKKEDAGKMIFFDVEVFPNLFLVNWKIEGKGKPVVRMINPTPAEIEDLMRFKLVGFNCRRYDNHILYARLMGYTNEQLFNLSQKIISGSPNSFFGEAYNVSYTDVYDFSSKKQSLKKFQIELGIHHKELGLPWDKPVPKDQWLNVAEYCDNDVIATEAVFEARKTDFMARQILADIAGLTVNDTTNTLTTKIIFGNERTPQTTFNYRKLSEPVLYLEPKVNTFLKNFAPDMMSKKHGKKESLLPYFPDYIFENGKSIYRGEEVGEGGYVYSEPGMYGNVALLDITSMHPYSAILETLFGLEFTKRFKELVEGRVCIKNQSWDKINDILNGKLSPYAKRVKNGEMTSDDLANALKIAINSVYGLTAASFNNAFKDNRNLDNIVAKRGSLFMVDLKNAVQEKGFTVAHIKTDSIKIPDATDDIIKFVKDFGRSYGYEFNHEATYDKLCLVNDAVYIAKEKDKKWTAVGAQFKIPYVFKTLFSKEPIKFDDLCETKSVTSYLYLDMNEDLPDVSDYEREMDIWMKEWSDHLDAVPTEALDIWERLKTKVEQGHDYKFVGKIGRFCPIKSGCGGGLLLREAINKKTGIKKYSAVTGTKGYRWLESEMVKDMKMDESIDLSYYDKLVNDSIKTISKFGDYEWFVSDENYILKR